MDASTRVAAAVLAGGMGVRVGGAVPKAFREVRGKPLILHSLLAFDAMPEVDAIRVAVPAEFAPDWDRIAETHLLRRYRGRVHGGVTRAESALAVLRAMETDRPDLVLIHDAARPIVSNEEVTQLLEAASSADGAILAARPVDTLWRVGKDGALVEVVDRTAVVRALTPQAFPYEVIREAYEAGLADDFEGTDDASYVLRRGGRVLWVPGTSKNLKVTFPEDFVLMEAMLGRPE